MITITTQRPACTQCASAVGLQFIPSPRGMAVPDGTNMDTVNEFMANPPTCPHATGAPAQVEASDEWLALNARLGTIPIGPEYDAIRTRLTNALALARTKAEGLGGLI